MHFGISDLRILVLCLFLTGCATHVAPFSPDKEFLRKCEPVPVLAGLTGEAVLKWAESAGPGIKECARNHNALVTVIEAQK